MRKFVPLAIRFEAARLGGVRAKPAGQVFAECVVLGRSSVDNAECCPAAFPKINLEKCDARFPGAIGRYR